MTKRLQSILISIPPYSLRFTKLENGNREERVRQVGSLKELVRSNRIIEVFPSRYN